MRCDLIEGKLISVNTDDKKIVIRTKLWGDRQVIIDPSREYFLGSWADYMGNKVEAVEVDGVIAAINYADDEEEREY
ncbi:MAG: hypothetical protein WAU62_03700 [Dehalococcoidales bacterium]